MCDCRSVTQHVVNEVECVEEVYVVFRDTSVVELTVNELSFYPEIRLFLNL